MRLTVIFADVDPAFDSLFQFDERAVVSDAVARPLTCAPTG